jgi:hypothetical protein
MRKREVWGLIFTLIDNSSFNGAQKIEDMLFLVYIVNNMKKSRPRFTMQEKLAILGEVHLNGLEDTLRKYHLTVEMLGRWQKKFKRTKSGNFVHPIEQIGAKATAEKPIPAVPAINEKEEELLRLVASLIVKCVLEKNIPNR